MNVQLKHVCTDRSDTWSHRDLHASGRLSYYDNREATPRIPQSCVGLLGNSTILRKTPGRNPSERIVV